MRSGQLGDPGAVGLDGEGLRYAFEMYKTYERASGLLPGGVFTVARQGELVFADCFGVLDIDSEEPMKIDSIFNIASMTKTVTSVAIMILYDRGLVGIDDPLSKYFSGFERSATAVIKEGAATKGGEPKTAPAKNTMTVRHLMTHTAGFGYGFLFNRPDDDPTKYAVKNALAHGGNTLEDFRAQLKWLPFEPGTQFRYGPSSTLLGYVVEAAAGMPLDEFMTKEIFEPLGMVDTFYTVPDTKAGRVAKTYMQADARVKGVSLLDVFQERHLPPPKASFKDSLIGSEVARKGAPLYSSPVKGDAGLFSTPLDWHKFALAALVSPKCSTTTTATTGTTKRLLSDEAWALMVAPATPDLRDGDVYSAGGPPPFCSHWRDTGDESFGRVTGEGSGGPQIFLNSRHGGVAHCLTGEVVTSTDNALQASVGAFGWEGIYSTKYTVDPAEGDLVVTWWSAVAPCWRFNLKAEILPLVYASVIMPERVHRPPPVVALKGSQTIEAKASRAKSRL